jgi:hypothetical protein
MICQKENSTTLQENKISKQKENWHQCKNSSFTDVFFHTGVQDWLDLGQWVIII